MLPIIISIVFIAKPHGSINKMPASFWLILKPNERLVGTIPLEPCVDAPSTGMVELYFVVSSRDEHELSKRHY